MIVDASVAVKWVIDEDGSDLAKALLDRTDLVAPTLVHAEVGNALWKKQRRGELSHDIELAILPALFASLIRTIDETPMMARALDLAREFDQPVYDCIYLATAEALGSDLITADLEFSAKFSGSAIHSRIRMLT